MTSTERELSHWEHGHLVAALDCLNAYQRDRKAKVGLFQLQRRYSEDPRTRLVELLKRWLRSNANSATIGETELQRISNLCRDVMNHADLFQARNRRSFMRTVAEVYQHLQLQLREVLERDRTCAELARRVLSLSKNLISDAIGYLLVAATDLRATDMLPSLEVVALWSALPSEGHPLPRRVDLKAQRDMQGAWRTTCGSLVAGLVRTPWCLRLFEGAGAQAEAEAGALALASGTGGESAEEMPAAADAAASSMPGLLARARMEFSADSSMKSSSGLAGVFRRPAQSGTRMDYLSAVEVLCELAYLLGEALVQFHRISDGLGDYGMIRVSQWLHPFLEVLVSKVNTVKKLLVGLNEAVDANLVLPVAKGEKVDKPVPSTRMVQVASGAIARAVTGGESHAQKLLQAIEDLKARSSKDRLPAVLEGLGDACAQLDAVLSSPQFRACVGDSFPTLPRLVDATVGSANLELLPPGRSSAPPAIADAGLAGGLGGGVLIQEVLDDRSDDESEEDEGRACAAAPRGRDASQPVRRRGARSSSRSGGSGGVPVAAGEAVAAGARGRERSRGAAAPPAGSRDRSRSGLAAPWRAVTRRASAPAEASAPPAAVELPLAAVPAVAATAPSHDAPTPASAASPADLAFWEEAPTVEVAAPSAISRSQSDSNLSRRGGDLNPFGGLGSGGPTRPSAGDNDGANSARRRQVVPKAPQSVTGGDDLKSAELQKDQKAGSQRPPRASSASAVWRLPICGAGGQISAPGEEDRRGASRGELRAEVYRLVKAPRPLTGFRRHDRRGLRLDPDGCFEIFQKSSAITVKTAVNVATELEQCSRLSECILSLTIQRPARGTTRDQGVWERKVYIFEFARAATALAFERELARLQGCSRQPSEAS